MGRLSSEKQSDNAEGSNVEETGMISGVSELDLSVTITTEGSRFLGKTASCSRLDYKRSSIKWRNSPRNPQLHIALAWLASVIMTVLSLNFIFPTHSIPGSNYLPAATLCPPPQASGGSLGLENRSGARSAPSAPDSRHACVYLPQLLIFPAKLFSEKLLICVKFCYLKSEAEAEIRL